MHALPVAGHEHHAVLLPHVEMLATLAGELDAPGPDIGDRLRAEHRFVVDQLLPHMGRAEEALYPELERLLEDGHAMSPLRREHEQLRAMIAELGELAAGDLDLRARTRLRRILYAMHAMLRTHLAEEEAYLGVLDRNLDAQEQQTLVRALEHGVSGR